MANIYFGGLKPPVETIHNFMNSEERTNVDLMENPSLEKALENNNRNSWLKLWKFINGQE